MKRKFKDDEELREWLRFAVPPELFDSVLLADGLAEAFLGVTDDDPIRLVYSIDAIIGIYVDQGMDEAGAAEYVQFNILGAYVGPHTPLFIYTPPTQ